MHGASYEFFARPAFAVNDDRALGGSDGADRLL